MSIVDFSKAKWIWGSDNKTPDQKIVIRKTVEIDEVPESAEAYIACDTKFWLWINGELAVFEGCVFRESVDGGYAEKVDLAPYLKKGANTFAFLVQFYGNGGRNNTDSGEAGFIFSCDALELYSDDSFLVATHPAYVKTAEPYPAYLFGGYNIGFDAHLDFGDFTEPDFPEIEFEHATVYPNNVWGNCVLSPLPLIKLYDEEKADYIIMAIGSKPDDFVKDLGLELNKWGNIKINELGQTSKNKIYAGGDLAGCKGTIAWAAKSGRDVAYNIINNL